ncbi:MAG: hypothetical protein DRG31_02405 [Deltaproteobacteria bacterium]|nr:MAG: hypothetical protein DRG31_02405 [Deltaproteobacteria bacterium]
MLNWDCRLERIPRVKGKEEIKLDFQRHDLPLTPQEAQREAARCLGSRSCEACDLCRLLCPDLAITRNPSNGQIQIDLDYCKGCGICAAVCPKGAIKMVLENQL